MGKDIKIGLGLAIILILFLIAFLMTNTTKETPRDILTEDTQADVVITGAEEPAPGPPDDTLFGPPATSAETFAPPAEGPLAEEDVFEEFPEETTSEFTIEPAPQPVETPPAITSTPKKYTVRKGDTLESIAKEFYGDAGKWPLIQKANDNIHPRKLRIGMILIIPDISAETKPQSTTTPAGKTHTIVKGDSLWSIAQKYYGDGKKYELIMKANNISDSNEPLTVGRVLKIPPAD